MDWSQLVGPLVQAGLPALGGLLGGSPGSAIGGWVGNAIANALGVPPEPAAIARKIEADPDGSKLALARVEAEAATTKAYLDDMANARAQTIQLAQAGSSIAWAAPVVSLVITVGFFAVMALLFIIDKDMPANQFALFNILFGVLAAQFAQVGNYWLGSSEGSRRNGDAMRAVAQQAVTPSPTQVAREAISAAKGKR